MKEAREAKEGKEAREGKTDFPPLFPFSRGFTLLELLVSAALAVLTVSAVAALAGRGLTAWQRAQGRLEQLFVMEKGLNQLGEEFRNSVAALSVDPPFSGTKDRLDFITGEDPTHLVKVAYRLLSKGETQTLIKEWRPFSLASEKEPAGQIRTVVPRVNRFVVEYGYEGKESGDTPQWEEVWGDPRRLPLLLKVWIETKDPRGGIAEASREFWVPHGVLGTHEEMG